jgi:hypothetical protein
MSGPIYDGWTPIVHTPERDILDKVHARKHFVATDLCDCEQCQEVRALVNKPTDLTLVFEKTVDENSFEEYARIVRYSHALSLAGFPDGKFDKAHLTEGIAWLVQKYEWNMKRNQVRHGNTIVVTMEFIPK